MRLTLALEAWRPIQDRWLLTKAPETRGFLNKQYKTKCRITCSSADLVSGSFGCCWPLLARDTYLATVVGDLHEELAISRIVLPAPASYDMCSISSMVTFLLSGGGCGRKYVWRDVNGRIGSIRQDFVWNDENFGAIQIKLNFDRVISFIQFWSDYYCQKQFCADPDVLPLKACPLLLSSTLHCGEVLPQRTSIWDAWAPPLILNNDFIFFYF